MDGLDPQVGVTTSDPQVATFNAPMVRVSRETVVLLDSTELGQRSLSVIASVDNISVVITDTAAARESLEALRGHGIQVTLV